MPKITFIDAAGENRTVDADIGVSVMETAINNSVPGIDGDCGGCCSCATCHVYVDEAFLPAAGEAGEAEKALIEFSGRARPNSRLSCQIEITAALDGLSVTIPEAQR